MPDLCGIVIIEYLTVTTEVLLCLAWLTAALLLTFLLC